MGLVYGPIWHMFRTLSKQCAQEVPKYVDWVSSPDILVAWLKENDIEAEHYTRNGRVYFNIDLHSEALTMLLLRRENASG